jgi:hypothetical protein
MRGTHPMRALIWKYLKRIFGQSNLSTIVEDHIFNDDLLIAPDDRARAAELFPRLIHVLDDRDLRQLFSDYDKPAKRAKNNRRHCGYVVVSFAVLALFGASAEPIYGRAQPPWPHLIGIASAALAIISVLVGLGLFNPKSKVRWLRNRLMTERLRQFHFQGIVAHIPMILRSMRSPGGRCAFLEARRRWFAGFKFRYVGKLDGEFDATLSDNPIRDFWLHDQDKDTISGTNDTDLQQLYDAYELFRFRHQINYADHMLSKGTSVFPKTSQDILELTRLVSMMCILVIFVTHFMIALLLETEWFAIVDAPLIHIFVVWVAVVALATRALEEGLQPAREVERYSEYRSSLLQLLAQFKNASKAEDKWQIMCEAERVSYQEMRGFLKTNNESRFII